MPQKSCFFFDEFEPDCHHWAPGAGIRRVVSRLERLKSVAAFNHHTLDNGLAGDPHPPILQPNVAFGSPRTLSSLQS